MSAVTISGTVLPIATSFPEAGVGGTYYNMTFSVPVYAPDAPGVWSQTTWQALDDRMRMVSNLNTTYGVAAGISCSTLIYLLVLTPNAKRQTAFHQVVLCGLLLLCTSLILSLVSASTPGLSMSAMYLLTTMDFGSSTWSHRFFGVNVTPPILALLAFVCACVALFMQAQHLLIGMRLRFPRLYRACLYYLAVVALGTCGIRTAFIVRQTIYVAQTFGRGPSAHNVSNWMLRMAHQISYPICIASYNFVNLAGAVELLYNRPRNAVQGTTRYTAVVNLIALLSIQSGIIPIVFSVLLLLPGRTTPFVPEILLLPAVYLLLPLATIFANQTVVEENQRLRREVASMVSMGRRENLSIRPTAASSRGGTSEHSRHNSVVDWTERELDEIDAMNGRRSFG